MAGPHLPAGTGAAQLRPAARLQRAAADVPLPPQDRGGPRAHPHRIQKTLDREGLRVGGILTDLFGRNGRIVLDGLVEGHGPQRILGRLTPHVRAKADRLARVLQAELEPHSLWRLRGLLQDFDAIAERIEELDRRVERAFADHRRTLDMLETLPGVARCSAHAILAELGPEPTKVFPKVRSLTAWAGLCPATTRVRASGARGASAAATPCCASP